MGGETMRFCTLCGMGTLLLEIDAPVCLFCRIKPDQVWDLAERMNSDVLRRRAQQLWNELEEALEDEAMTKVWAAVQNQALRTLARPDPNRWYERVTPGPGSEEHTQRYHVMYPTGRGEAADQRLLTEHEESHEEPW